MIMEKKIKIGLICLVISIALIGGYFLFSDIQKETTIPQYDNETHPSRLFCSCISISETNVKEYAEKGNCTYSIEKLSSDFSSQEFKEKYDMSTLERRDYLLEPISKIVNPTCITSAFERELQNIYIDKSGKYMDCDCRNI